MNLFIGPRVLPSVCTGAPLPNDRQILQTAWLATRCQRGDRAAFDGIVRLWERPLFYYLRRLTRSEPDAWDLLQETWLKTFRALPTLRDTRTLPAFLYATARNAALTRLRSEPHQSTEEILPDPPAADTPLDTFDDVEQVHHALDQLPLPQREALTLYFLQDLSIDQIAALLGVPVGTVKSRLHYAKRSIRQILTQGACHAK